MEQSRHFDMPKDFFGIEEVEDGVERSQADVADNNVASDKIERNNTHSEESPVFNGGEVAAGGIEEVECPSRGKIQIIDEGVISWERMEDAHKARMRRYIVVTALILWAGWTLAGLMALAYTGNPILLISSPTTATGVALYKILSKIVTYYFPK